MILEMAFVMFLGLLVFGPRKTLEMSQAAGRSIAHFKRAASEVQAQIEGETRNLQSANQQPPALLAPPVERSN
ncbi:MAG: Sec-independent protein translocase subunit TatA/TatB [Terriglobales bacterium]